MKLKLFFNDVMQVYSFKQREFLRPFEKFLRFAYEVEPPDVLFIYYSYGKLTFTINWKLVELKGYKLEDSYFYALAVKRDEIEILDGKLCLLLLRTGYGHLKVLKTIKIKN